jgi:hypothetical protein
MRARFIPIGRVLLVGVAALVVAAGQVTAVPAQTLPEPRVIGGTAGHPWSALAVAWNAPGDLEPGCTGALWRPRILVTAAHCVVEDDGRMVAAGDISLWPPGANKQSRPASVKVSQIVVDSNYRSSRENSTTGDIAFFILSAPLGQPLFSRFATANEVAVLVDLRATLTIVGYGLTGSSERDDSLYSDVPLAVDLTLTDAYLGDRTFEGFSAVNQGVCNGDSGGPFVAQVGDELLYVGPLSSSAGPPCDPSDGDDRTVADGAIASMEPRLASAALAAAGESPEAVPVTCVQGPDVDRDCNPGQAWTYSYCWGGRKVSLQERIGNRWRTVARTSAAKSSDCDRGAPFLVEFAAVGHDGTSRYRVVLPKQKGLPKGGRDPFTVQTRLP